MGHGSTDRRSPVADPTGRQGASLSPILTILYDNTPYDPRLKSAWGFSCLVEWNGKTLMFDTGSEGRRLLSHMEILGKDPEQIDMVFLSHIHGDHTGGLRALTARSPQLEVYVAKSFPPGFDEAAAARGWRVIRTSSPMEISPGVFSTGEMGAWTKEQSLMLKGEKGTIVLTGCAHPGIGGVIKRAKSFIAGGIRLAIGGYHLSSANELEIIEVIRCFKEGGVEGVCPCHCTGDLAKNLLRESYGEEYIEGGVGRVIGIP